MLLVAGGVLWAAWPGFLHVDAMVQLQEARSGHYGGWQPAAGSWLWHALSWAWPAPAGVLIFQCGIYFTSMAMLAARAHRSLWRLALVLALPAPLLCLGPLWKDSQMAVCLLASMALASPLFSFAALCFRPDAIVALLGLAGARRRGTIGAFVLLALVGLLAQHLAPRTHFVSQQIFIQDLAAISAAEGRSVFPDFFCVNVQTCATALAQKYSVDSVTPVLFDGRDFRLAQNADEYGGLLVAWSRNAPLHPWLLVQAHAHRFLRLLGILRPPSDTVFTNHPLDGDGTPPLHARPMWEWAAEHVALFAAWPYVLILLLRRQHPVAQSGLAYLSAFFFIAPAVEFRYLAWPVMAAAASLLVRRANESS